MLSTMRREFPRELVSHAFSSLNVQELVKVALTSRTFRDIAYDQRAFRYFIEYDDSVEKGWTKKLFYLRLTESRGRPIALTINLAGMLARDRNAHEFHKLMGTLQAILGRLTALRVTCKGYDLLRQFWQPLCASPAPELSTFALNVTAKGGKTIDHVLPTQLFGGHAPNLNRVTLAGVPTPALVQSNAAWAVPAFSNATDVRLDWGEVGYAPNRLMVDMAGVFPRAKSVTVETFSSDSHDDKCRIIVTEEQRAAVRGWTKNLECFSLTSELVPRTAPLVAFGVACVPSLELSILCAETIVPIFRERTRPNRLSVQQQCGNVRIDAFGAQPFASEADFKVYTESDSVEMRNYTPLLHSRDLMSDVTHLDIDLSMWRYLLDALLKDDNLLPQLRILDIAIDDEMVGEDAVSDDSEDEDAVAADSEDEDAVAVDSEDEDAVAVDSEDEDAVSDDSEDEGGRTELISPEHRVALPNLEFVRVVNRFGTKEIDADHLRDAEAFVGWVNTNRKVTVEALVGWQSLHGPKLPASFDVIMT